MRDEVFLLNHVGHTCTHKYSEGTLQTPSNNKTHYCTPNVWRLLVPVHTHQDQDKFDTLSNKLAKHITHTHASTHTRAAHLWYKESSKGTVTYTHSSTHINTASSSNPVTLQPV